MTHTQLSQKFREIGRTIASLPAKNPDKPTDKEFNHDQMAEFELFQQWIVSPPSAFGREYRGLEKGMDEALSTASVRELIIGISQGLKDAKSSPSSSLASSRATNTDLMSSSDEGRRNAIARWLVNVSAVRLETKFTGFALFDLVFQHPTGSAGGIAAPKSTGSLHYTFDRARRQAAAEAGDDALKKSDATIESVFKDMLGTAGVFTTNVMVGPAESTSMSAYTHVQDPQEQAEQNRKRNYLKQKLVDVGVATMGSSTQPQGSFSERRMSPPRDSDLARSRSWERETSLSRISQPPAPASSLIAGSQLSAPDSNVMASAQPKSDLGGLDCVIL